MERYVNADLLKAFFKSRNKDLFSVDTICSVIDLFPDDKMTKEDEEMEGYVEITNRIQQEDNMNKVYFYDEKGPGGGYHEYMITNARTGNLLADVLFQKGPRKDAMSVQGVLETDLLEIVRHRLNAFCQGDMADENTEAALISVELALLYLNRRKEERKKRGVLGTMEK